MSATYATGTSGDEVDELRDYVIKSVDSTAFVVGPNGKTNPTLSVDASTASAATGLKIKSAAAAGGMALSVTSSGAAENLTLDAKGTGTVTINGTATGAVVIGSSMTHSGNDVITVTSANALAVGQNGTTNPAFNVDDSTATSATGINVKSAAAAAGVAVSTISSGTNENLTVDAKGSGTIGINTTSTTSGVVNIGNGTAKNGVSVQGPSTMTSANTGALQVGPNGTTNPTLQVDTSTASAATGLLVKSAAVTGGVALSAISSGAAENLTINAKGAGTIVVGGTSTGQISLGRGFVGTTLFSSTIASLGTVQNSTPTAAQLLGGIVTQTSSTGAGTVTTPTGTVLSAAIAGVAVGDTFETTFANLGGGFTLTITAGASGMTVVGNAAVASGKNALLTFVNTGANTWNCYVLVSA